MSHRYKLLVGAAALAVGLSACGSKSSSSSADASSSGSTTTVAATPVTLAAVKSASDLRNTMDLLLSEHIVLATKATSAAVYGNTAEFTAYSTQLNNNGTDIGALIGAAYGSDAQNQFNQIWSAHDGYFVDYTKAAASGDAAGKAAAVTNLTTKYVPDFSKFISTATGLPLATVTGLVTDHVTETAAIVDDEVAKNYTKQYADFTTAFAHMQMIGDPVSEAIATKFPDKFSGNAKSTATDLQVTLNQGLQAHMYLASFATGAALGGHTDEFTVAGNALNTNGTALGAAIGSVFGTDAQTQFNQIWSAHNGYFVDYTKGVAAKDTTAQAAAVTNLTTKYVPDFSKFISDATGLPNATVTSLITMHVTMTKQVVDDQAAGNWTAAASDDRSSAAHMESIANPLASSIVTKFPTKFSTN